MKNVYPKIFILIILPLLLTVSSCGKEDPVEAVPSGEVYSKPEQTGDGWETASLNDVGMDENTVLGAVNRIQNGYYLEIHSIVIVKENKLVFERYFPGHDFNYRGENFHGDFINYNRDKVNNTHSATKSIASALVGIAVDKGFINSVDEKIFSYFTNYSNINNTDKDKITVKHLLTMTSGFEWNEWDVGIGESANDVYRFNISPDPVRYVLEKPVITEPGTSFYYNCGGVDLLGEIIRIASGMGVDDFSEQYLFGPLGITNYQWQRLSSGLVVTHGDVMLRPRDQAKFGYLFLNKGEWNGQRILSESWVERSTEQYLPLPQLNWADGYGYLWWLMEFNIQGQIYKSYCAEGWGDQKISVFPELDMVVVFTGANYTGPLQTNDILERYILPAVH